MTAELRLGGAWAGGLAGPMLARSTFPTWLAKPVYGDRPPS